MGHCVCLFMHIQHVATPYVINSYSSHLYTMFQTRQIYSVPFTCCCCLTVPIYNHPVRFVTFTPHACSQTAFHSDLLTLPTVLSSSRDHLLTRLAFVSLQFTNGDYEIRSVLKRNPRQELVNTVNTVLK